MIQPEGPAVTSAQVEAAGESISMYHEALGAQCTTYALAVLKELGLLLEIDDPDSLVEFEELVTKKDGGR